MALTPVNDSSVDMVQITQSRVAGTSPHCSAFRKAFRPTGLQPRLPAMQKQKWRPWNGIMQRWHHQIRLEPPKLPSDLNGVHDVLHLSRSIFGKAGAGSSAGLQRAPCVATQS